MFRASSAHLQEDIVVYKQHMVPSLSIRVPGDLSIRSWLRVAGVAKSEMHMGLVEKHARRGLLVRSGRRWEYNIKMDVK